MRPALFFKIAVMIVSLFFVVTIIRELNTSKVENALQAIGIEPGTSQSPGFQPAGRPLDAGEERFNICRTRIHSITWPSGRRVEEFKEGRLKLRWVAVDPRPREIGYMEVEKWLSAHCQIITRPLAEDAQGVGAPSEITIRFVDDSSVTLRRYEGTVFDLKDLGEKRLVESPDLVGALLELQEIAQFDPASGE